MSKPVILTGLRANNDLHIGNYFGALLPLIDMAKTKSEEFQINLFVPDLHSFITPIDHTQLYPNIMHNLRLYVAAGLPLDNPDVHMYRQSFVPAHSELTWILNCFTGMGQLGRMTQYKDKSAKLGDDQINVGLFGYPVLMAADILLYGAVYVPVGDDQTQHLEFTRDIAERMNAKFNQELFTLPKPVKEQHEFFGKDQGLRIKDLADPTKKMSKSDDTGKGVIFLGDNPEAAAKKIMSATTDSEANIHFDFDKQPGISNLLQIHSLLSGQPLDQVIAEWEGKSNYGDLKRTVADAVKQFLTDFQSRLATVDDQALQAKIESDEFAMNETANATLERVQRAVGLRTKRSASQRAGQVTKPQYINLDHFSKLNVRAGTVIAAERLNGSDKLIKLQVDLGNEKRQILTGMQEYYSPEDFLGKQLPILVNLAPRTMMGEVSEGMLLALEGATGPVFLQPEQSVPNGAPLE